MPNKITDKLKHQILKDREQGLSIDELTRKHNVSRASIYKIIPAPSKECLDGYVAWALRNYGNNTFKEIGEIVADVDGRDEPYSPSYVRKSCARIALEKLNKTRSEEDEDENQRDTKNTI